MQRLKSTTAVLAALSLALPGPLAAQDQGQGNANGILKQLASDLGVEVCDEMTDVPCLAENGALMVDQPDMAATLPACDNNALPCATDAGMVLVDPKSELAMRALALESEAEVETEEVEAEAEAETEVEAEAEMEVTETETEETESDVTAADEASESDDGSTIEEDTTAETEMAPEEGEAVEIGEVDEAVEEDVEETAADATETEATDTEEMTAETEAEAETEVMTEAETAAEGSEPAEVESSDTVAGADEAAEVEDSETMAEADEAADPEEVVEAERETVVVEEAPTAAAASAGDDDTTAESAEVEVEEVTEETARSSSEDFQTTVTGEATAQATAPSGDDGGLSNFEKALLLGLGAVAVGSILDNGDEVVSNSGDRLVLQDDQGNLRVLKNDDALLRQPGAQVQTETFSDGSTRTIVNRDDGTRIITIRDANGRVLRRVREFEDGSRVVLFDDTEVSEPVDISTLPQPRESSIVVDTNDEDALRLALAGALARDVGRTFSLSQVRQIREVRELAPELNLDAITFATGSAAIDPTQAEELTALGRAMSRIIDERPGEVFLIEGHTDAVGSATYNLALSDRRAETVALALAEYFDVPPENMITQGYGESALKVPTQDAERQNRRATIRRITPLLQQAALGN